MGRVSAIGAFAKCIGLMEVTSLTLGPLKEEVFVVRVVFFPALFLSGVVNLSIHLYNLIMDFDGVTTHFSQCFIQVLQQFEKYISIVL